MQASDGACSVVQVTYLIRELWHGLSARATSCNQLPGGDKGLHRSTADLVLTRCGRALAQAPGALQRTHRKAFISSTAL
jgi:hypothetical protein